jgi:mono/diheme cytochrome c family protein
LKNGTHPKDATNGLVAGWWAFNFGTYKSDRRSWFMKRIAISLAVLAMMMSTAAFADDGAALYASKCAMCHKADGSGGMGPSLKGKTADAVAALLANGGQPKPPHTGAFAKATADEQKAIAGFVATLK